MKLKKSMLIALVLTLVAIIGWELYLRANMQSITKIADDKALWAVQRAKVDHLSKDDVILTGSSRVLFDIQLDVWEEKTGIRPVQLACAGSSPLPVFHDIVNNSEFTGTVVVGVTPGLFFSTTFPQAQPWRWPQERVEHFQDRTYADRLNHQLSIPLQKSFYFVSAEEDDLADNVDLKAMLQRVQIGTRVPNPMPPFYQFGDMAVDRNVRMTDQTVTDTAFANTIKKVWRFFMSGDMPPPDRAGTTAFFTADARKFIARGGNLILVRCPSTGFFDEIETQGLPRTKFWDVLVDTTGARSYHFQDYEPLTGFDCPEWSHLSAPDADKFTSRLLDIMIEDEVISTLKND